MPAQGETLAQAAAPALEARGLTLAWDDYVVARDVSLRVEHDEIVCLVGRSGCGKSTLFHTLAGLTEPLEGSVSLNGADVTGQAGYMGYMLQKDLLLPNLTVEDNAALPLMIQGMPRKAARAKVCALLPEFGLEGTEKQWPCQLSGGMRQRVALLRTHLMAGKMVLMDEPFSALDAITRKEMQGWLKRMVAELGLSVLLVTHDVDEACALASRVYVMRGNPRSGEPSTIAGEAPPEREAILALMD